MSPSHGQLEYIPAPKPPKSPKGSGIGSAAPLTVTVDLGDLVTIAVKQERQRITYAIRDALDSIQASDEGYSSTPPAETLRQAKRAAFEAIESDQ